MPEGFDSSLPLGMVGVWLGGWRCCHFILGNIFTFEVKYEMLCKWMCHVHS